MRQWGEEWLPIVAMVSQELLYAITNILSRVALVDGLSPWIYVFYRQAFATIVISPIAYLSRQESGNAHMDFKLFLLIFITSFIGTALLQSFYVEGLYFASASVGSAMFNIVPAITFVMVAILRLEQVNMKKLSNMAKMVGTCLCVGGAIAMTIVRGQKLLNAQALQSQSTHNWLIGCLLLLACMFCCSLSLILEVPMTKWYRDYLSLSAWMAFTSTVQTGIIALFLEHDFKAWIPTSGVQIGACLFSGIVGSGVQYFIQFWCIARKGALFTAMFSPISTVLTTLLASIFIHEQVYIGTLLGAIVTIIGLYVFLWGQAQEMKESKEREAIIITIPQSSSCTTNLQKPLLASNSSLSEDS